MQDLRDLATLIESRRPAFEGDATFDAETAPAAARKASAELLATMTDASRREARVAAKALRDRANTFLAQLVGEIREAGKYAYRKDPERARLFTSGGVPRTPA